MQNVPNSRQGGLTLVELVVVIGLLAIIAAIAVPAFSQPDEATLDRAATEVAAALRFAQAESVRTGVPHGVRIEYSAQRLSVYRLDETVSPAAAVYDIRDPFSKALYSLQFDGSGSTPGIESYYFKFEDIFLPQSYLGFAADTGVPKYNDSGTDRMLETGFVRMNFSGISRTVSIAPVTGRVTVQ